MKSPQHLAIAGPTTPNFLEIVVADCELLREVELSLQRSKVFYHFWNFASASLNIIIMKFRLLDA